LPWKNPVPLNNSSNLTREAPLTGTGQRPRSEAGSKASALESNPLHRLLHLNVGLLLFCIIWLRGDWGNLCRPVLNLILSYLKEVSLDGVEFADCLFWSILLIW